MFRLKAKYPYNKLCVLVYYINKNGTTTNNAKEETHHTQWYPPLIAIASFTGNEVDDDVRTTTTTAKRFAGRRILLVFSLCVVVHTALYLYIYVYTWRDTFICAKLIVYVVYMCGWYYTLAVRVSVFVRSFARLAHIQTKNVQVYERSLVYVIIKYNIAPAAVETSIHTYTILWYSYVPIVHVMLWIFVLGLRHSVCLT